MALKKLIYNPKLTPLQWREYFHYYEKYATVMYEVDAVASNVNLTFESKIDIMYHLINNVKK